MLTYFAVAVVVLLLLLVLFTLLRIKYCRSPLLRQSDSIMDRCGSDAMAASDDEQCRADDGIGKHDVLKPGRSQVVRK